MKKQANILHVYNTYLNETENWSYNQLNALSKTFNIHIASVHHKENSFDHSKFTLHYYPHQHLIEEGWSMSNRNILQLIKKFYVKVKTNLTHSPNRYFNSVIQKHNIDIIHYHFADVCWRHLKLSTNNDIPFIVSFYGWDYEKLPHTHPIYIKRYLQIFKLAQKIIVEGEHGKQTLIKMGCPSNKIELLHLGITENRISKSFLSKTPKTLKLIQVSSFKEKKGIVDTLQSFAKAKLTHPNIQLTIGGDGDDSEYQKQINTCLQKLNLQEEVTFIGPVKNENLMSVLKQHHVFIHPSRYASDMDCEGGAPIVILDAQACGLPVISTNHCDIPEEVIHNETGYLVKEGSISQLTEAIIDFANMDQATYERFSESAISHVRENYHLDESAKKLTAVINKLLE